MSLRDELLRAISEAARVYDHFSVGNRTSFDIVGAVTALDIPLIFRPLKKLWGATISVGNEKGVLITTVLDLHVQRFTLAHELGHVLLGHQLSLDESIGFAGRFGPVSRPVEERAADTFASELLAPKSLMLAASKKHKWTKDALSDPRNIYQLGLRLGISFQATCWALAAQEVLSEAAARNLQDETLKEIKQSLAPEQLITNSWANVWKITEDDTGSFLEAGPDDLFLFHLSDHASAGYLWQLVDAGPDSQIVHEQKDVPDAYGAPTSRVLFLRFNAPGQHRLVFEHRRPWNKQRIAHIDISIENYGKERGGFARKAREEALALESA